MKEQWVLFTLAGQMYCTTTGSVREIIKFRPANPVPGAPAGVEGIITVRKDKIALYSGHALVLNSATAPSDDGHIILLESAHGLVGVSLDGVEGVIELDSSQIEPWQSTDGGRGLLGTLNHENELVTAVNLVALCEDAFTEDVAE